MNELMRDRILPGYFITVTETTGIAISSYHPTQGKYVERTLRVFGVWWFLRENAQFVPVSWSTFVAGGRVR